MTDFNRDDLSDQSLDWEEEGRKRVYDGFRPVEEVILSHRALANGEMLGPMHRQVLLTSLVTLVIPYDPVLDAIVVIRQFRLGAAMRLGHAAMLELPGGMVDEGEFPQEAARRELEEETGLRAKTLAPGYEIMAAPALTDELAMVFLAIVDASTLAESAGNHHEHEDIRPIAARVDDLIRAADDGRIVNGYLVGGLNWFARKGRAMAATLISMPEGNEP
ncbi:NUDIX domain-containing protein [Consotaella aegiceratis]|uniref:NUDIX domain-containing protein n=1 Tax=Consotaella aegiceratis TaxID=3097961 RepID=UPI002F40BE77